MDQQKAILKAAVQSLINDYYDWELPNLHARKTPFREIKGKASVVIGMRRTGKTCFCLQHLQGLIADGMSRDRTLYLSFENERLLGFQSDDFQTILDVYFARFPKNKRRKCYFILDEIQRIAGWESFARRVVDHENIHLILTGSSAKLLSKEIATAFRGRSLTTEVFPLSFAEFLEWHNLVHAPLPAFSAAVNASLRNGIARYFDDGGFPEVQSLDNHTRNEILQSYIDTVLFRDIVERYRIGNVTALRFLIKAIMNAPGQKFSVSKFSNKLKTLGVKCSRNDLYIYLDYLADSFLVFRVPLHTHSVQVQRVNPDKLYIIDSGLARAVALSPDSGRGMLLENLVFLHLRRQGFDIEYLQTDNGYEVDFVVRKRGMDGGCLVQVAYDLSNAQTHDRETRAMNAAGNEFRGLGKIIVTWDDETRVGDIQVLPAWKFLLLSDAELLKAPVPQSP